DPGRLVVGSPAEPPVSHACPVRDGIPALDLLFDRVRCLEIAVDAYSAAVIHLYGHDVARLLVVQSVIQAREHARGIPEGGMIYDVLYALAVDPDLTAIVQTVEILLAGEGSRLGGILPLLCGCLGTSSLVR